MIGFDDMVSLRQSLMPKSQENKAYQSRQLRTSRLKIAEPKTVLNPDIALM